MIPHDTDDATTVFTVPDSAKAASKNPSGWICK